MHIGYIAPGLDWTDSLLWIQGTMQIVSKNARKHPSFKMRINRLAEERTSMACEVCGAIGSGEWHHVKPVWATSIDFLLSTNPKTHKEIGDIAYQAFFKAFDFSTWHELKNLKLLCSPCHLAQQKEDDLFWRRTLARKYRLVYSYRWGLAEDKSNQCKQMSFDDYVAFYLNSQDEKLSKGLLP